MEQVNVNDRGDRIPKNEVCESCKRYFEALLDVSVGRSAEITDRPGTIVRVLDEDDQIIPRDEIGSALKKLKKRKNSWMGCVFDC